MSARRIVDVAVAAVALAMDPAADSLESAPAVTDDDAADVVRALHEVLD